MSEHWMWYRITQIPVVVRAETGAELCIEIEIEIIRLSHSTVLVSILFQLNVIKLCYDESAVSERRGRMLVNCTKYHLYRGREISQNLWELSWTVSRQWTNACGPSKSKCAVHFHLSCDVINGVWIDI
jgi:hypothetical protein